MSRLSLRARLVLGVLVVAAAGLVVADIATYAALRSSLLDRVDRSLEDDHHSAEGFLRTGDFARPFGAGGPGVFVQVRSSGGQVLYTSEVPHFPGAAAPAPPELPETISVPESSGERGPGRAAYSTVPSESGGERYRVRASVEPGSGVMLIIAESLADVDATLQRLLAIELFVTLGVLAAIALLGLWIVRLGLRPLDAIGKTADEITAGDLSHRVERAEPRTEVGRLGLALNTMLDRIETSDRRLRRFVGDASHELRTPLAAVRAYAELFARGADRRPDDLARAMAGISRESQRMGELVDDLLLLARLDEGQPLEREPVELDEVAAEAVETARALDPARPIDLQAEPAVVFGDRARLRRVIDNLLGNVRSHTPPETPAHVSVTSVNGSAVIEVADEGPGIPADDLEHVFDRFYRTDTSRSRESGGVGLGLSIVAAIAEAHHGRVSASTADGGGATFRVELPLADATH
ncbi:MAG TPA: HAMP domain-containing sensor histidine kinase [Gaiellaceae bacterium]|jgi:two-component system OmpR family sensor kinase